MSTLYVTLISYAGGHIDDAAAEACALATRIGINVSFTFNGVECFAEPGSAASDLLALWNEAFNSKKAYRYRIDRIAYAHGPKVVQ